MAPGKGLEFSLKALVFADDCDNSSFPAFSAIKYIFSKPVLSWQLSTLARFGVKEAIVLSKRPVEIEYSDPLERMSIAQLNSSSWHGEGDALREIDRRSDIRPQDDFVIVRCGSIFNVDVGRLVMEHKARRAKDRKWLLTSVFRRGTAGIPSGLVVGVEAKSGALIKYSERCTSGVSIDVRAESAGLGNGGIIEICSDVVDAGLDVCSPDILIEFNGNFDFDRVRALTREKLESGDADTLGDRMYAHFTDSRAGEYAARIDSLAALAQITIDIFNGWMLPVSLGSVAAPHQVHHFVGDVYMCPSIDPRCFTKQTAKAFHSAKWFGRNCVVGRDTAVANGARIYNSVIGDQVSVGEGALIENSIICANASIGDNSVIQNSIVSDQCTVQARAKIPANCFLDQGVVIGADFQGLRPYSLLSKLPDSAFTPEQDFDDDGEQTELLQRVNHQMAAFSIEDVGHEGVGRLVTAPIPKSDPFFSPNVPSTFFGADGSDEDDELEEGAGVPEGNDGYNEVDDYGQQNEGHIPRESNQLLLSLDKDVIEFHAEVYELLERDRIERIDLENTILETNSLRMTYDLTFAETLAGVIIGIARSTMGACLARGNKNIYAAFVAAFKKYMPLVEKYAKLEATHDFEVICTLSLCFERDGDALSQLLYVLYDQDIIDEDGIHLWAAKEQAALRSGQKRKSPFPQVKAFVEWLKKDEEEDE